MALVGIAVVAVVAFFFLAPIVPMRVNTVGLYIELFGCDEAANISGQTSLIFTSVSYASFHQGVVYVPSTVSLFYWLPSHVPLANCG